MAQFTNQAQLTYNNETVNSNVAVGEILEVLSATKTAVTDTYARGDDLTFVISVVNSGSTALEGVTVTDNLGAYAIGAGNATPLSYVDGSVLLYRDGVLSPTPTVSVDPVLSFGGISLPAGSSLLLIYEARVNEFAPLDGTGSITNVATVTANGIPTPVTATETVTPVAAAQLTVTKSVDPVPVSENGRLTYTFVIQNYGNVDAVATDDTALTDLFDPILSALTVVFNGTAWAEGTNYTYDAATGAFATLPGQITVPAATFVQNPQTGAVSVTPGVSVLTVSGTL